MTAFEILLNQDPNLKLEEQAKVLRGIVSAYARLRQNHKVDDDSCFTQQGPNGDRENKVNLQLSRLDVMLSQLTSRVEVCFRYFLVLISLRFSFKFSLRFCC